LSDKKSKFLTAHQIDGHKGIKSPHAHELDNMGKEWGSMLLNVDINKVKEIVENELNGKIENLDFGEDYTITIEFFPEVNIHILYYNYLEDEAFGNTELRFLFSGERVNLIPAEDLTGYIEAALHLIENYLENNGKLYDVPEKKSPLLQMAIRQRIAPFKFFKKEDLNDLANFVGAKLEESEKEWKLVRTYFNELNVILSYTKEKLDISFQGNNVPRVDNYSRDQLGIHLMNHCLRFLLLTHPDIEFPKIVKQMFSYSYIKSNFE